MKKRKIPLGISSFKDIIDGNYYYCDKTKLIEEILDEGFKVNLFTRPRRFGKTLNMSTLKYFFDVKNAEENRNLFKNLYIEKSEYFEKQGQHPVIFISFKNLSKANWQECMKEIKNQLYMLYGEFEYIRDTLNIADLNQFDSIWLQKEEGNYGNALKLLTSFLMKYYDKKIVVLIDEYDTPIISAYGEGYYKEAISFFKEFYGSVLKDNEYLELGVLTGILQVAKEGIFSGLNNITIHNILENRYASYFGFVQEEVENALIEFELKDRIEDVKTWYDGYRFGKTEVYNPWSILYYLYEKELGAYWVNTSSNDLIKQLLKQSGNEVFEELKALFSGGTIEKSINKYFNFNEMSNLRGLWELFVFSGYLKLEDKVNKDDYNDDMYLLKIPNLEVKTFFYRSFIENFLDSIDTFREMLNALKKKDIETFSKRLQTIFNVSVSYHDIGKDEKYYHNILLGMILSMQKDYYITSNREDGQGRYDIILEPKDKINTGFVLEFKVGADEEELEKLSAEAIEQIKKKEYASSMRAKGINDILAVGIAFHKKKTKVKFENI